MQDCQLFQYVSIFARDSCLFVRIEPDVEVHNAFDSGDREEVRKKGWHHQANPPAPFPASDPDLFDEQRNCGCENSNHQRA